jgi:chaperonin GroES
MAGRHALNEPQVFVNGFKRISLNNVSDYHSDYSLYGLTNTPLFLYISSRRAEVLTLRSTSSALKNFAVIPNFSIQKPRANLARRRSTTMATATATVATTFTPLHDRILVRRVEEAETIRGGIIIPDTAKEKPQEGEVIAVGKGKSNDEGKVFPLDVKAGDRILFGKYSGTEIKIDGEEYLIMREEEVLGILKK